jgi:palmitoyltransferase ZDHHC6
VQEIWPPQDPYKQPGYTGPAHDFSKDTTPWTYGNGVNPNLQPSNTYRRAQISGGRSNVPPYHPAYQPGGSETDDELQTTSTPSRHSYSDEYDHPFQEEDDERVQWSNPRVRRGSEGFEVREVNREEVLRRYIESRGEEAGRYRRYVPESSTTSEDEDSLQPSKRAQRQTIPDVDPR